MRPRQRRRQTRPRPPRASRQVLYNLRRRLGSIERRYERSAVQSEHLRQERNIAVFDALDAGMTHEEIAAETGLNRSRVGQIARTRNE